VRLVVSDWTLGGNNEEALRDLVRHGVQVKISRVPEWSRGYVSFARVEHCKYMAADGEWLWVGTSNWEPGYFLDTRNLGLTIHDPGADSVAGKLAGREEAGWPPADNENILHHAPFLDPAFLADQISFSMKLWPHPEAPLSR